MCPEVQVPALDLPCPILADVVFFRRQQTGIAFPTIGAVTPYRETSHFIKQLPTRPIIAPHILPGDERTSLAFNGIPRPTALFLAAGKTPKLIHLNRVSYVDI
jgi:hypothetical protein